MDDQAVIAGLKQAAPGRRGSALMRIVQGLAPNVGRLQHAVYFRAALPTIPLPVLKVCGDWRGYGGTMRDDAIDAEMAPFLPPDTFRPSPCPHPWTAGQPGLPDLPPKLLALLRDGADPDTCAVIADWLEQRGDAWSAAYHGVARWGHHAGLDATGPFAVARVDDVTIRLRWVTPGRFQMGNGEGDAALHTVRLTRGFWIAETPVTRALWQAVGIDADPSRFKSPDRPVHGLSWDQAQTFCAALAQRIPGARLPTEAQWECAARAGTAMDTWVGDVEWGGAAQANDIPVLDPIAWYTGNCGVDYDLDEGHDIQTWVAMQHPGHLGGVHRVAQKAPNPLGLFDVVGNVSEWCQDRYAQYPGNAVDPQGPDVGERRVHRGGMWCRAVMHSAQRAFGWPSVGGYLATGVRIVI